MANGQLRHMRQQPRWALTALVPIAVGILWFVYGWDYGLSAGIVASIPGAVMCGAGASQLLWPGARHSNYYLALCSAGSVPLALAMAWILGIDMAVLLMLGGLLCSLVAGYWALSQDAISNDVPAPDIDLSMATKAALDEGFLGFFIACSSVPRGQTVVRDREELERLEALSKSHNWTQDPELLHRAPDAPQQVALERAMQRGHAFDWIAFDSDYTPPEDVPGGARWLEQHANRRMYARVFRHTDGPRPWLMCLHGYRMGTPMADFSLFDIERLHKELGLNVIMPILPLHGIRRHGRLSGSGFLDGRMMQMFHAEVQTLWDIRRCLAWLRAEYDADDVGVLGYSLGGYNAALLAALEADLACVIAGIPLSDIPATLWRNIAIADQRYMQANGLSLDWLDHIMKPISPLHWQARVPHERRYIFAATGDQIVSPDQPEALWRHWEQPTMYWYQGTHMSVRREPSAAAFVDRALRQRILAPTEESLTTA